MFGTILKRVFPGDYMETHHKNNPREIEKKVFIRDARVQKSKKKENQIRFEDVIHGGKRCKVLHHKAR